MCLKPTRTVDTSPVKIRILITVLGLGVIAAWIVLGVATWFVVDHLPSEGLDKRAQFGDMFGVANALFSALALAGVIIAILLQRQELQLQRADSNEMRKEVSRSAAAQENLLIHSSSQAKSLTHTATLNALNSVMQFKQSKLDQMGSSISPAKVIDRDRLLCEIEMLANQTSRLLKEILPDENSTTSEGLRDHSID